ncbi:hypothetical protein UlMin_026014 [Ulmus minor]
MEDQCSSFNWEFWFEEEGGEELWHSLKGSTLELETKVASTKEEIIRKEDELVHLKYFLNRAIKERDEAESKCQTIMLDILMLQEQLEQEREHQQLQKLQEIDPNNEQQAKESQYANPHFTSSEAAERIGVESQDIESVMQPQLMSSPWAEALVAGKPLPEKGKLLQAVMEAGPLLKTLLVAGPLPQWQHPPPPINSIEIPPVTISRPPIQSLLDQNSSIITSNGCFSHKRSLPFSDDGSDIFSSNTKYQKKVVLF